MLGLFFGLWQVLDHYIKHIVRGTEARVHCNVAKKVAVANHRNAKRQRSSGDINQPLSPTQVQAFFATAFSMLSDPERDPLVKRKALDAMASAGIESRAGGRVSNLTTIPSITLATAPAMPARACASTRASAVIVNITVLIHDVHIQF